MSEPRQRPHLRALPAPDDGWKMLLKKEVLRFWRVALQTIAAPVLTAVLYLLIFGHVLEGRVQVYDRAWATSPSWCPAW
jgi:ABC-2 type transport system permease protein